MQYQAAEYHNLEIGATQYIVKHEHVQDHDGNEQSRTLLIAPNRATYVVEPVYETVDGTAVDTGYRTVRPQDRSDSVLRDEHGRQIKLFQVSDMLEYIGYFDN